MNPTEFIDVNNRDASTLTFQRIDLAAAFAAPPPPLDFIWPGFLAGTVGVLSSPGGSGKSLWALEALCAVSGGRGADLLDLRPTASGRGVYLCLEDPYSILLYRLYGLSQQLDSASRARLTESCDVYPLRGLARLDLRDRRHRDSIARALDGVRIAVIDTLSRAHAGDENSNAEMALLLTGLEWICERTGCAILLLHHTRKGGPGESREAQQAARGASALIDNARWGAQLMRMSETEAETMADAERSLDPLQPCRIRERRGFYVRLDASKVNYGPPEEVRWYRREEGGVLVPARLEYMPTALKSGGAQASKVVPWRGRPASE